MHGLSRDSSLVCLGCYNSLDDEDPLACSRCGLFLCQESCQDSLQHQPECQAFQAIESGKDLSLSMLDDIPSLLDIIMIVRCINLRQSSNDEWFKLNQLQAFSDEDSFKDSDLEDVTNYVVDLFEEHFAHIETDRDILLRLYGILTINAFEIPNSGEGTYVGRAKCEK